MQSRTIEIFYLLFQGVLVFQVVFFGILYFTTRKKDMLYYSLFLFFAAVYFFVNAPYTFFGIPEENVWASAWYDHINTPLIIVENLFYLLFLKAFFHNITTDKVVTRMLLITLRFIPFLITLFILLSILRVNTQSIFYTVKMISAIPAAVVAYIILKRKILFASLVAKGLICTVAGTSITVFMIVLRNNGIHNLFTMGYPLLFIRLGLLGDMIFYLAAILKKWHSQEKQFALEKIQSLVNERFRISRELHDEVGATLSGIAMYSHLTQEQIKNANTAEVEKYLNIMQQSSGEMVNKLNDIVWLINPEQDNLQKLIQRLEEYARDMAAIKNMNVKVKVPDHLHELILPVESRRNIYLFCKEAINNAVKYSDGTLLELTIKETDNKLEFSVSDNGKGFNAELVRRGNGLDNMQKRADEVGAKLIMRSKEEEGSYISMQLKIT